MLLISPNHHYSYCLLCHPRMHLTHPESTQSTTTEGNDPISNWIKLKWEFCISSSFDQYSLLQRAQAVYGYVDEEMHQGWPELIRLLVVKSSSHHWLNGWKWAEMRLWWNHHLAFGSLPCYKELKSSLALQLKWEWAHGNMRKHQGWPLKLSSHQWLWNQWERGNKWWLWALSLPRLLVAEWW
jgi:hypothetical protein